VWAVERPGADDLALGHEEPAPTVGVDVGGDDADGERPQALEACELGGHVLERSDPIAKTRRILEALGLREAPELVVQLRNGVSRRLPLDSLQCTCRELRLPAALERSERPGVEEQMTESPRRRR